MNTAIIGVALVCVALEFLVALAIGGVVVARIAIWVFDSI